MEEVNQTEMVQATLPKFLKVLCILTFVATGLGVVFGLYNLVKAPYAYEEFQQMQEMTGDMSEAGGFVGMMMQTAETAAINAFPLAIGALGANLFCLFGALMMWKQRKIGFYAYVCGQAIGVTIPMVFMGVGLLSILGVIFPLAFVIMYALNLKHMS